MQLLTSNTRRLGTLLLFLALALSGCSKANNDSSNENGDGTPDVVAGDGSESESDDTPESPVLIATAISLELVPDKTFRISWERREGAQTYRVFENPNGIAGYSPVSESLDAATLTFDHRVALYLRVNASYMVQTCNTTGCVDSESVYVQGTLDEAVGYIKASNPEGGYLSSGQGEPPTVIGGDRFGASLSISDDGNTLAVSAPNEDSNAIGVNGIQDDNTDLDSGAVYVFVRGNEGWQQQAYLKASKIDRQCCLGGDSVLSNTPLSLSGDGNTLAVGAGSFNRLTGADYTGEVFVFTRSNGDWQQQAILESRNARDAQGNILGDRFGQSLSLTTGGDTLVVGAPSESVGGVAYVFTLTDGQWQEQTYLEASNADRNFAFGSSVAISADGKTLVVGATGEGSLATGAIANPTSETILQDYSNRDAGAAYVFVLNGNTWQQQALVKASNPEEGDRFGGAVTLSADGNTLAITATGEDGSATGVNGDQLLSNGSNTTSTGAVYLFSRSDNQWQQHTYLKASNSGMVAYSQFGSAVSLSADGDTLAVGARGEAGIANGINGEQNAFLPQPAPGQPEASLYVGAAYVFALSSNEWQQVAYVKATNNTTDNENIGVSFGEALSLSGDGQTLVVGSDEESGGVAGINGDQFDRSAPGAGAVFVY